METYESFDWFREDIKTMNGQRRGKWVTTKGVALFPTVSRNQREYIEKECMLSARTLAGVPIDVNHQVDVWLAEKAVWEAENEGLNYESIKTRPPTWGNVIDAEWEDKTIEYVAQLRGEYGEKMIDREILTEAEYVAKWGKTPIRGVSISASYRYASDDEDMLTPLGIKFNRLSLVEDPESPGVTGTSIELMESYNRQSLKEIEVVGILLKSASPSLFETYRDEVIEPYKEGKPLDNKEYVDFPVELNYGELHVTEQTEEDPTEEPLEEEPVEEEEPIEESVDESEEPVTEEEEDPIEEKADDEEEGDEDEKDKKKAEEVIEDDVENDPPLDPLSLETLDFSAFDVKPELAEETGDVEVDEKITEVNAKRKSDYEESRDKNVVESLKNLDEKLVKLVEHQNKVAGASSEADNAIGVKVAESLKGLKEIQDRLDDKAGVDKVEKLKTVIESLEEKIEGQAEKFKDSDTELRQVIETVTSAVSTIKEFVDVTDDIKTSVEDKEAKLVQLKSALETSNENNVKLATKLGELESSYTEKLDALTEKLDTVEKSITTAEEEKESAKDDLLEKLKERLENIEETLPGNFKGNKEAEHDEEKSIDDKDVFKDIT